MQKKQSVIPTETEEQIAVLEYCDIYHMPYFHVNNEMWTESFKQKATATSLGVKKGVPDLHIFIPIGRAVGAKPYVPAPGKPAQFDPQTYYQMIAIEMKRTKGSKTSAEQLEWQSIYQAAGIPHFICKGAMEAIEAIKGCVSYYKIKPSEGIQTR